MTKFAASFVKRNRPSRARDWRRRRTPHMADHRPRAMGRTEAEATERRRAENALKKAEREAAIAAAINEFLNKDLLLLASPLEQASFGVTPDANLRMSTVLQRAAKRIDGKFPNELDVEMQLRL